MSTYYRYTNITTKGNLGLVAENLDVISQVDGQNVRPFPVGQPIVWDPTTNKTLSVAGIATAKKLRFGVGHNPNKNARLATEIRTLGASDIDLCRTALKVEVEQPACPTPHVIHVEWDCTKTGRDYMFQLDIDDWLTRAYYKEGAFGSLLYNLRTDVTGCDNCSEEDNNVALACQLAAKINGDYVKNFPLTSKLGMNTNKPGHGVWAHQKFDTKMTFALAASAVEDACGTTCAVKGLKSIDGTGISPLVFENAVDPSAPTQTLLEQLGTVIDQINAWLYGKGSAYLMPVDCCTYSIVINSCIEDLVITYHDDSTNTGTATAAFAAFTPDEMCVGCGDSSSVTHVAGVIIYVDPLLLPCNCEYPDGNPPAYFGRTAKATMWGDGWNNTTYRIFTEQEQTVAAGTGYQVQQAELKQSWGGEGRDYIPGMDYSTGNIPLPLKSSLIGQAPLADCETPYCIWSVVTEEQKAGHPFSRHVSNAQTVNWINTPIGDEVTVAAIQSVLEALDARGYCTEISHECIDFNS